MAFQSKRQRQAVMAKRARGGGSVRTPQLFGKPMSRTADVALLASWGPIAHVGVGARGVRRISERQYSVKERMARRGTVGQRTSDVAKQYGSYAGGAIAGGLGGFGASKALGLGGGKLAAVTRGAGLAAGLGSFVAARSHVNKLRDVRLKKAGGTIKRRK